MRFRGVPPGTGRDEPEKRLVRVLTLLRMIEHSPGEWSRAEIAQYFQVSERMIDKDLQLLRAAGYDVRRHRTGYEIHATPDLPAPPH